MGKMKPRKGAILCLDWQIIVKKLAQKYYHLKYYSWGISRNQQSIEGEGESLKYNRALGGGGGGESGELFCVTTKFLKRQKILDSL